MAAGRGAKNYNWKGRARVAPNGYLRIEAGPQRGMYVHQLVAMAKLGRALQPGEHVHHRDENPLNNDPDNLAVLSAAEHGRVTRRRRSRAGAALDVISAGR